MSGHGLPISIFKEASVKEFLPMFFQNNLCRWIQIRACVFADFKCIKDEEWRWLMANYNTVVLDRRWTASGELAGFRTVRVNALSGWYFLAWRAFFIYFFFKWPFTMSGTMMETINAEHKLIARIKKKKKKCFWSWSKTTLPWWLFLFFEMLIFYWVHTLNMCFNWFVDLILYKQIPRS